MSKYPNGGKITTNNSESSKGNEANALWNEGISQIYLSSELVIHEAVHDNNVFHLYASSSLDYGSCPYCGHVSSQVHSRYFRTLQDMSILARELSYTSKRVNSFVTIQIVRRRPLQSSQAMRCSATEDAPVDAKGR